MSNHSVHLQKAFIVHNRKYRESSLIIEAFTEDFGVVSLVARGVRKKKSKWAGVLQPFTPLKVSYTGKAEMKTLIHAEIIPPLIAFSGLKLYCGFYVNELIQHFLYRDDAHPEIFGKYQACLEDIAAGEQLESTLRLFELELLENIGYGLQLDHDAVSGHSIDRNKYYHYQQDSGPVEMPEGSIQGVTLQALGRKDLKGEQVHREAKCLMRQQIDYHLQGKVLNSRALMSQVIRQRGGAIKSAQSI